MYCSTHTDLRGGVSQEANKQSLEIHTESDISSLPWQNELGLI
jgi:hypothetical protein